MKKRIMHTIVIVLCILFSFSLGSCRNNIKLTSYDKTFEQTIEQKLNSIINPKNSKTSLSSNPYEYIKGMNSNEDYKFIVSQGEKSLEFMLQKFADGNEDGLEEYIMAMACSEILKEDFSSKKWDSGREWYLNYVKENS